eukprot:scaffold34_cov260-Pinguiococcus_pyrenoidosus.AAC.41
MFGNDRRVEWIPERMISEADWWTAMTSQHKASRGTARLPSFLAVRTNDDLLSSPVSRFRTRLEPRLATPHYMRV